MPELERYRSQRQAQNQLRVVDVKAAPANTAVGDALQAAGELMARIETGKAQAEAAKLEVEAKRQYDAAYRELEADPDVADQLEGHILERSKQIREGVLGQVKSRSVREMLDVRLSEIENGYVIEGRNLSNRRSVEAFRADVIGLVDGAEKTAKDLSVPMMDEKNPNTRTVKSEIDAATALIDAGVRGGFMGKDVAAEQKARLTALQEAGDSARVLKNVDDLVEAGRIGEAEEFFKVNYNRILPSEREQAEKVFKAQTKQAKAVSMADEYWAASGGNYAEALNQAYLIDDPDLRLATETRLAQLKNQFDVAINAKDETDWNKGMEYITTGQKVPASVMRDASPKVRDLLQSEERQRALWAQQMATLSAEERRALKEASAIGKDYLKGFAAIDPETYLAGPMAWPEALRRDWENMTDPDRAEVLADIQTRTAKGGTFDEADKVLKDLTDQIPMFGPDNRKGSNYETGSAGKSGARKLNDEERAVRASLYRQAQEYARRTGGADVTPADSKLMIARAFREANPKRYPFEEPGSFVRKIGGVVVNNRVYESTRAFLAEEYGREPTDAEVADALRAIGEAE